jgi:SAM-dependent methyltransferase
MSAGDILKQVDSYFRRTLREHGPTASGVDWNSPAAQRLRFPPLLCVCDTAAPFSLTDYGCGYGALAEYLADQEYDFTYQGYDICADMIRAARELHGADPRCRFESDAAALGPTDYAVASGTFNVKLGYSHEQWQAYVLGALDQLNALGRRGFAFNLLTCYADPERMRDHLYYADPCSFFDHCKVTYSRQVALLHDYGAYEFTVLVRKEPAGAPRLPRRAAG